MQQLNNAMNTIENDSAGTNGGSDFIAYNIITKISSHITFVFQNELKKKLFQTQDREKHLKRELSGLKTEHQWVLNNQKSANQSKKVDESGKAVEALHHELKEEREKVKNLAEWKSQLTDKNKELKQENEKYVTKFVIRTTIILFPGL